MFPELKKSLRQLIILSIVGILLIFMWHNGQIKRKQREINKNKFGVEIINEDIKAIRKEISTYIKEPIKDKNNSSYFGISYKTKIYYYNTGLPSDKDPLTRGTFHISQVIVIDEFDVNNVKVIIYLRK